MINLIENQILNEIYELEKPVIQSNDFNSLFTTISDLIPRCRENIDKNITEIRLKEYLNNLWLDGKILRFLDEMDEDDQ